MDVKVAGLFLLIIGTVYPVPSVLAYNHMITVYASVPEQRAVYLDEFGAIIKIAGNTAKNITPKVYDSSNREVPMSPAILQQYDDFLKQHNNHLEAGETYNVNPITVSEMPNTQTIKIVSDNLILRDLNIN